MARHRRKSPVEALIELTASTIGIFLLLGFLHPQGRQVILGLGTLMVSLLIVGVLGLLAFALVRFAKRRLQPDTAALEATVRFQTPPWEERSNSASDRRYAPEAQSDERYKPPEARTTGPTIRETLQEVEAALKATRSTNPFREAPRHKPPMPLVDQLRSIDWFQFEKLIEILYRKQGYRVERRGGANADGGIDLVLTEGSGQRVAVQCKHWKKWDIGVPKVRELVGAMTDAKIGKGILVTISDYTNEAKVLADRNNIEIVNHSALAATLERLNAHYDPEIQGLLNDTRKFCPKCEREMVLRTTKSGANAGRDFWGCSAYPRCRHMERT